MATDLLDGITCVARPVLNAGEQTLFNLCEEYFQLNQRKSNRRPVLSQVRLADAIAISQTHINSVQANAMSFDIVITDREANPLYIFEADGKYHGKLINPDDIVDVDERARLKAEIARQIACDQVKDAIAKKAGIPLFRVTVEGQMTHPAVVDAELATDGFSRDLAYPTTAGSVIYSEANYPDSRRLLTLTDIELMLVRAKVHFPNGWEFVSNFEFR